MANTHARARAQYIENVNQVKKKWYLPQRTDSFLKKVQICGNWQRGRASKMAIAHPKSFNLVICNNNCYNIIIIIIIIIKGFNFDTPSFDHIIKNVSLLQLLQYQQQQSTLSH